MKRSLFIRPLACTVALLLLPLAPAAFATDSRTVVFDGSSHKIVITPAEDLFGESTKGMMPGDSYTGTVQLRATNTDRTELFFTAAPEQLDLDMAGAVDLGSRLALTVRLLDSTGGAAVLYQGDLNGVIDPRISLGTYASGTQRSLEFTVQVPATLENAYQDTAAATTWVFYAEQRDETGGGDDPSDSADTAQSTAAAPAAARPAAVRARAPQTGAARASLPLLLGGAAACGAGWWLTRSKKNRRL